MPSLKTLVCTPLMIGVLGLFAAGQAYAGANPTIQSASNITFTQTDDTLAAIPNYDSATLTGVSGPNSIPAASPASFQLANTFTKGVGSNTVADAAAYSITSSTQMAVGLKTGTGVNQTNTGHLYTGESQLDIDVVVSWTIGSQGFPLAGHPPGLTYSFTVGGTVGLGGSDEFVTNLEFFDYSSADLDAPMGFIDSDTTFSTVGAFSKTISGTASLDGGIPLPANSTMILEGTIDFFSKDDTPSSIALTSDANFGAIALDKTTTSGIAPLPASWEMGMACMAILAAGMLVKQRRIA